MKFEPQWRSLLFWMAVLLMAFSGMELQAMPSSDTYVSARFSRSSWSPAVVNETGKLRAASQIDGVLYGGTLMGLLLPGVYYSYGTERQSLNSLDLSYGFGGERHRGKVVIGYGTGSPGTLTPGGAVITSPGISRGVPVQSRTSQIEQSLSTDLKQIRLGYDHEFYLLGDDGMLSNLGFMVGIQAVRDEFAGDFLNFNESRNVGLNSFKHMLIAVDLHAGLIYRQPLTETLEMEAGATLGRGVLGNSEAKFRGISNIGLLGFSGLLPSETEIVSEGEVRTSRFHLGLTYKVSPEFGIRIGYAVENRFYTPSSVEYDVGGPPLSFQISSRGPFYTQKDKLSGVSVEFQYRH